MELLQFRASPLLMVILLLIPVLLTLRLWQKRGQPIVLPLDHANVPRKNWLAIVLNSAATIPLILAAIAILILCGPNRFSEPQQKRVLTNIEFCVDISGSMRAPFGTGSRYDASMTAINQFLDFREGDAFGLTFFGHNILHWTPVTFDVSAIRCSVPFMRPEVVPPWFGGTMIGKALRECRKVLIQREDGDRMIILVSDGSSSDLYGGEAEKIAAELAEDRIVVYGIHIAEGEVPESVVAITAGTGGAMFNPAEPDELEMVFRRIDEMQPTRMEKTTAEKLDNYRPFCWAGLIALGSHLLCSFGLRYTPW